ncbi:helix-turn-helix domain-containing protein [Neobacillus mesonae]|uniref:helix-turn-helix domain-containing protein n=1 Tax=Neobacillus mesonae TaxID=1193713 RepID=UPI002E2193F7|nr:helix-turn-helix domain-containing protein [Neobacillus mesonae]
MVNLYDLTQKAKAGSQEAVAKIVEMFEPKVKKSSRFIAADNREDLEQELRLEIVKAVNRFETSSTPTFWGFIKTLK